MTVEADDSSAQYSTNGTTGPFAVPFYFLAESHLQVVYTTAAGARVPLTLTTDYSVAGAGNPAGGSITTTIAYPSDGGELAIVRNVPLTQLTAYVAGDAFPADAHERALDKLTMIAQQLYEQGDRVLRVPEIGAVPEFPSAVDRADKLAAFDSAGNPTAVAPTAGSATALALDLASTSGPTKGSGIPAHSRAVAYGMGTSGRFLNGQTISALEYHTGTVGNAVDDLAAVVAAIAALKANGRGGALIVPSNFSAAMTVPALALAASRAIVVIDQRIDRAAAFGAAEFYTEARDASGGYASELMVSGKQQPALTLYPRSDGTAPGYPIANNMVGIVGFTNGKLNNIQLLADPFAHGRVGDFAWIQYAQGNTSPQIAAYFGIDGNNKTRVDLVPGRLASSTKPIAAISNTSPIEITTSTNHGIAATISPVSISGTGTALDGTSWLALATAVNKVQLINSVAVGAAAAGTLTVQVNAQRATFNVGPVQGGTEAICSEGVIVSALAHGTAPVAATSQTADVNLHARPYVVGITGTQQVSGTPGSGAAKIVTGSVSLVAGTATVTLTNDAVFTGSGTYTVAGSNATNANPWKVAKSSGSVFTITGTGTDTINFIAIGY